MSEHPEVCAQGLLCDWCSALRPVCQPGVPVPRRGGRDLSHAWQRQGGRERVPPPSFPCARVVLQILNVLKMTVQYLKNKWRR